MQGTEINSFITNFDVLLTVHLSIFISVINQLDAQNFCFTVSLVHASTCFEHMCSSSGGQNCITQPHHTCRCDDTRGCVMLRCDNTRGCVMLRCDDTRGCVMQF
jgi:hypothetical protein